MSRAAALHEYNPNIDTSPLSPAETERALAEVDDRDLVIALLLRAIRTRADFACFFAVKRDQAVGRLALVGDTLDRERIARVRIPLSSAPFQELVAAGASTDPRPGGEELSRRLGGSKGVVLLPVPVGGRVVGIALGHCGDVELPAADLSPLVPVARAAGGALERLIVKAKEAGAAAPGASEDEQIEFHTRTAEQETNTLGRIPQAIEAWRRVLAIDAGDPRALDGLAALLERDGRWEELVELLEKRALLVDTTRERVEVLLRLADVLTGKLDDRVQAARIYERVAELDPANPAPQEMLEALYRAERKWPALCDLLLDKARRAGGDRERAQVLAEVARIYEDEVGEPASAFVVWQTAFRQDPADPDARVQLERLAEVTGAWEELLRFLAEQAEGLEGGARGAAAALWLSTAAAWRERLGATDHAIDAARRALRLDPGSLDAMELLAELLRGEEAWAELADVLHRQAVAAPGAHEKIGCYLTAGQVFERELDDPAQAIVAYEAALAIDGEHADAQEALLRLYRWNEAEVEPDRAIRLFRAVLERDPTNRDALRGLETAYEKTGRVEEYVETLEAEAAVAPAREQLERYERLADVWENEFRRADRACACLEKVVELSPGHVEAWRALARLAEQKLDDPARAVGAYERILDLDPRDLRALDAAARLHEQAGRRREAAGALARLIEAAPPSGELAEVHRRLARIHLELGERARAEESLARAVALDPASRETHERLVRLHLEQGDPRKAAEALLRAEEGAEEVADKLELLSEAARLYLEQARDEARGEECWLRVEALAPDHAAAAEILAGLTFARQEWAKCAPRLDVSIRHAEARANPARLIELRGRAARCAIEVGDLERAARHLDAAHKVDPGHLPTLLGRAHVLHQLERWEAAVKADQTILFQHREKLPAPEVARITRRQAVAWQRLGEPRRAADLMVKALELEPADDGALKMLAELQIAGGDWDGAIDALRRRLAVVPPAEQVKLLDEIGGIYREQLGNPQRAISSWREALELDPQNHRILQRVLDAHTEAGDWRKAVDTIKRFLELERDPARRGAYHQAAGAICRERLNAAGEALEHYQQALDELFAGDPAALPDAVRTRALETFREIDELLTQKKDWKGQERAYRRMIKRIPPGDPVLASLWHNLGEVCRSRLDHLEMAIEAFQIAQELDPANAQRKQILAELYLRSGAGRIDSAIAHHLGLLREEPTRPDLYRALYRLYRDAGEVDKAWCVARALVVLGAAEAEEQQLFDRLQPADFVMSPSVMSEDVWRHVYHPDESRLISSIFWLVWRGLALSRAKSSRALGLAKLGRVLVEEDTGQFSQLFRYTAKTLNMDPPDLFVEEKRGVMLVANCVDKGELRPGLIVRKDLLGVRSRRQIVFALARQLARMRPEHYVKLALDGTAELKGALLAALALVKPGFPVPAELAETVRSFLPDLQKHTPPRRLEELAHVVDRFLQSEAAVDLDRWGRAVEATAHRVALILCGDLKTATSLVSQERTLPGGTGPKEKANELLLYSVSEDYFAVRRMMGIQVKPR